MTTTMTTTMKKLTTTSTKRHLSGVTPLLVAALLFGCSAGLKQQTGTGGSGASSGGNTGKGGGAGGTGGSTTGTGGNSSGAGGNIGPLDASDLDGACAASSIGAQPVPLDLYFLMDSSKSMLDQTGAGTTKWAAVSSALNTFFTDSGSAGLGVALKYFPDEQPGAPATCTMTSDCTVSGTSYGACDRRETCVSASGSTSEVSPLCVNAATDCSGGTPDCALIQQCGTNSYCAAGPSAPTNACSGCTTFPGYCHLRDICASSDYATPNVAIGTLPGAAGGLATSLSGHTPDGYTPTGPALTGAVSWAQQQLTSNPGHKVAIVLVTDGLPGGFIPGFPPAECAPSDIPGISAILSAAATGTTPILTFVVGIFNPGSAEGMLAPENLMSLATAGGTGSAVVIDVTQNTVTQQLHDALTQAQTKAIACSYKIPPSSSGGTGLDYTKVNVQFTSGTGTSTTVGHTSSSAACAQGGWYYDIDPSVGTPTQIIACPSTCTTFNADISGHVEIVLGCATISIG
jgi:hypothetical protein